MIPTHSRNAAVARLRERHPTFLPACSIVRSVSRSRRAISSTRSIVRYVNGVFPAVFVQYRGCGGGASGDVFPSGDGVGVSPPATKMSSTRANSVSDSFDLFGEPAGPCRARSMTW